jgi:ribosomal protein S18 acetylase RimI-like enzyme
MISGVSNSAQPGAQGPAPGGVIRPALPEDASTLVALINALADETALMVISRIDPVTGIASVSSYLTQVAQGNWRRVLVADIGGRLAGLLIADSDVSHPAKTGVVDIDLGVLRRFQRRGIGRALLASAENWARAAGMHRLQLKVMTHNAPAIALYEACGFVREGTLKNHLKLNTGFVDQHMMAKQLI